MLITTNAELKDLAKICASFENFIKFVLGANPTSQQLEVIRAIDNGAKRIAVKSGHGTGKSCLVSWLATWTLFTKIDAKIAVTSPSHPQIKATLLPELRLWANKVPKDEIFGKVEFLSEFIKHENGNFIAVRTAKKDNPEALQGFHAKNLIFLVDEASGVDRNIFEVIEGSLTGENNILIMIGNPTRTQGYFYDAFNKNKNLFSTFTFNAEQSPRVSKNAIEIAKKNYGENSNAYRVRIKGEFATTSVDGVFDIELIDEATQRKLPTTNYEKWGLDIAGMGDDNTILCQRNGLKIRPLIKITQNNQSYIAMEIKRLYIQAQIKPQHIYIDNIGIGEGIYDILSIDNTFANGVIVRADGRREAYNKTKYFNKRTEMYYNFKEKFKELEIPNDEELIGEILATNYEYDKDGRFKLVSKKDIKKSLGRSPDKADAVALTFYDEFDDYNDEIIEYKRANYAPSYSEIVW